MKTCKKVFAIVLALALVLALGMIAFAEPTITKTEGVTGPASITVTLPTIPEGYTANNTYKIYKVFDAALAEGSDGISYTLANGHTTVPDGFEVDAAGNIKYVRSEDATDLTDTDIAAIAAYVTNSDLVATVETHSGDTSFTVTGLPYGYYYITTTTGTVVTVDSTHPDAEVIDKNEIPDVKKIITDASSYDDDGKKALAQVGTDVEFTATITVQKGAEGYVFHDKMSDGLAYNNDVKVYVGGTEVTASTTTFTVGSVDGDTITVTFKDSYIGSLADGTEIKFVYTATVTSDALQDDPANNTAYLSFGDENGENHTPPQTVEVYNAKISVQKTDEDDKPLAGADFVLKNSDGKYYKLENGTVAWKDTIEEADVHTSAADGSVPAFTGLANGSYTLMEIKAPDGYNKAADVDFTINEHDYTAENLKQSATVVNKEGPELPSTGGIGTTIFYIVGAMLVVGAAIVLIAKRRNSVNVF